MHHAAKVDPEKVLIIRELRKVKKLKYREIAVLFGLSVPQVHRIISRKTWRYV